MIDLLQQSMSERADRLDLPAPDLVAVVDGAGRRQRRRRIAGALGTGALVVAAGTAFVQLRPEPPHVVTESPFAAAFAAHTPTYSLGRQVHIGERTITLAHTPRAYVQTEVGLVYADADGTVYATDGTGETALGRAAFHFEDRAMAAGGTLAAWATPGDAPELVVFDQATGHTTRTPLQPAEVRTEFDAPVRVWAIDAGTVYASDARGVLAVTDGGVSVLRPPAGGGRLALDDVKHGVFAFRTDTENADDYFLGDSLTDARRVHLRPTGTSGALSPDGSHLLVEVDDGVTALIDTSSGAEVASPQDYEFQLDYAWIDDTTYAAIAISTLPDREPEGGWTFDLLTCDVAPARCEVSAAGLSVDDGFSLPLGADISAG